MRNTYAEIDLDAIRGNICAAKKNLDPKTRLLAVVKANAYGHGSLQVARAAIQSGASYLAVALAAEGAYLRTGGITAPILILGVSDADQMQCAVQNDLELCVASLDELKLLGKICLRENKPAKVHLKLDTGMGRIGFTNTDQFEKALKIIAESQLMTLTGLFSHLACADEHDPDYTQKQASVFQKYAQIAHAHGFMPLLHLANSAAVIQFPQLQYDMARWGISLYGYYPSQEVDRSKILLTPAMRVFSQIVYVKEIQPGTSVSYGATYTADSPRKIATIPIGYGDGYPRLLSNCGKMIVISHQKGYYAPICGRVCMDQTMIDVSDVPDVSVGCKVVVLGSYGDQQISADDIAALCNTISYEVLLSFNERVPRVYLHE